jgi:hypothetical protein
MFDVSSDREDRRPLVLGGPVSVDLVGADHVDHGRALAEVDRLRCQVDAAEIDVVVSAMERGVHIDDGHRSTNTWIAGVLDVSRRSATLWVQRGALGQRLPEYVDALRDGRFHLDHFDVLARAFANPRVRGMLGQFLEQFVGAARKLPFPDFEQAVAVWVELADQDGREPVDRVPMRGLNIRTRSDGSCSLNGFLHPEAATVLREIIGRFLDEENRLDRAAAADDLAAGGAGAMPRTLGERRADALMAALSQSVTKQPGEPARPLCELVVSWHAAQQMLHGADPARPADVRDLLCRSMNGEPIDIAATSAALIEGRVRVLVVDALGNPFAQGKPGSLFIDGERHALRVLHPRCEYPGCPVHSRFLQADHVQPRSRGGPTSMDNSAALCGHHNRWRFTHDYHVQRDADGRLQAYRPDGTPLHPPIA